MNFKMCAETQKLLTKITIDISHTTIQFPTFSNSYLSFKERLMDFLNSHEGHEDDKHPLMGDCRNSEDVDKCF